MTTTVKHSVSEKPFIIMKFGGTSLGTSERVKSVIEIVKRFASTYSIILVLSAMSSYKKSQGTTSRLLKITELILPELSDTSNSIETFSERQTKYLEILDSIRSDHLLALQQLINSESELEEARNSLNTEFTRFSNFLEAVQTIEEVSVRSRDVILSFGEKISCLVVSAALKHAGVSSVYCPLDKLLGHSISYTSDIVLNQVFYDNLGIQTAKHVLGSRRNCNSSGSLPIPVVTGFIGHIPGGLIAAVGRGYTDFTAALIASGIKRSSLEVKELQIWKEVDGIFTADPTKVPTAKLLKNIYPDEAAELTYYGSEVIHPFTMEQVTRAKVGIRIKNTFQPEGPGTLILVDQENEDSHQAINEKDDVFLATAVSVKTDIICLNIRSNRKSVSHGFLAKIFSILDKYGIVVDLISTSEVQVSLAMGNNSNNLCVVSQGPAGLNIGSKLDRILKDLEIAGDVMVAKNMAILSLVGKQMKNMVGISGKMFSSLATAGVNIEIISQGSSEINISCVILESEAGKALKQVHDDCVIGLS